MKFFNLFLILGLVLMTSCNDDEPSVNQNPLIDNQTFTINENSETGTVVGTVIASDERANILEFNIISGNTDNAFVVDSNSGLLTVSSSVVLDFEVNTSFELTIEVSDGELSTSALITIDLLDIFEPETGQYIAQTYSKQGADLPYRIMFPNNYDGIEKFPILFFLHGAGERGADNSNQLVHGSSLFKDSLSVYPSIVVFPQCADGDWWANNSAGAVSSNGFSQFVNIPLEPANPSMLLLESLIDSLVSTETVDQSRVYVAGLSMGGMGTSQLLAKKPDLFAAGVVIAGLSPLDFQVELAQTPTSIFHGLNDNLVSPSHSNDYFSLIDDSMGTHRLIQYTGVGHGSWNKAFAEPDFLSWIFSKSN